MTDKFGMHIERGQVGKTDRALELPPPSQTTVYRRGSSLEPEEGCDTIDGRQSALFLPVWLKLPLPSNIRLGCWVRIRYIASLFDESVRPLIRFVTGDGTHLIYPMNGPVLGTAEWIGRVPDDTRSASISPVRCLGPFTFRLQSIEQISPLTLWARGILRHPWAALWSVEARVRNLRKEAWIALKTASDGTPFESYHEWYRDRTRPLDLEDVDRPKINWSDGPTYRFLANLDGADPEPFLASLRSLREQLYQHWSLCVVVADSCSEAVRSIFRQVRAEDARVVEISARLSNPNSASDGWAAVLILGDTLQNYALAAVTEMVAKRPHLAVAYSDQDAVDAKGRLHSPVLKPDWSPIFYQSKSYLGRPKFLRSAILQSMGVDDIEFLRDENDVFDRVLFKSQQHGVCHIRRVLSRTLGSCTQKTQRPRQDADLFVWPEVAIIIPTRDRLELLSACIAGLQDMTDYPSFKVVIVDNGSTDPATRIYLSQLSADSRLVILRRPGPFNFSYLSNEGARNCQSSVLVFLNNDVEITSREWLKALVRLAVRPDVGAVGSKLLFKNGKIQHAGVVLGMGGIAGHVYDQCASDHPGYLDQLKAPREVTAVTGACMVVERNKFDMVGGFDEVHLPVDLNDIDLCLRLAKQGWVSVWTPESELNHLRSASRGIVKNYFEAYRRERYYFAEKWLESIRDDCYFHPALKLLEHTLMLG